VAVITSPIGVLLKTTKPPGSGKVYDKMGEPNGSQNVQSVTQTLV
jgi:hypothetical protein